MSNEDFKDVSDDDLKKIYSECCNDLDAVESKIRNVIGELDKRQVEKEGRESVSKKELEELIKKWSVDSTRGDHQEAYQKCLTDLSGLIHTKEMLT